MKLTIKEVKACRNGAYGNYIQRNRNSALITISLKLNERLADYGATLLHEMLHFWTTAMRLKGFRITNKKEHDFIYDAEMKVIRSAIKYAGRKK